MYGLHRYAYGYRLEMSWCFHCSSWGLNSGRVKQLCAVITDKLLKQQKNKQTEATVYDEVNTKELMNERNRKTHLED